MHIVFAILICMLKLTEKPRVFHQPDVPLVFPLQNYKWSTKEVSGWNQCNIETENVIEHMIEKRDLLLVGLHVHKVRKIPFPLNEWLPKLVNLFVYIYIYIYI